MEGEFQAVIGEKIIQGLEFEVPGLTRREVHLPEVPGKALAVVGMRRSGKTTFLWQCMADQLTAGVPRETLLYFNFEDDRLDGLAAKDLHLYRDWETDRKSTRLNSSHSAKSRMPSSA